jgi:predicted RNase H-like nuclease
VRASAAAAQRKVELERIEDEVDAIACAHLAWLWTNRPGALQVYGDVTSGYIVAPPAPTHPAVRRPRRVMPRT